MPLFYIMQEIDYTLTLESFFDTLASPWVEGIAGGLILGIKTSILIFVFIWVRASFPRIRFDQLMLFSWTILLPLVISFIILVPCILYSFEIIPSNIALL
jgi:NADH-ubiquinone oxidoreductase chain 1